MRSELDVYVEEFVKLKGVKLIMFLIDSSCNDRKDPDYDMIYTAGQILAAVFKYASGIESIQSRPKKYFERFLELADINEYIKK